MIRSPLRTIAMRRLLALALVSMDWRTSAAPSCTPTESNLASCPGVTTQPMCGEEQHTDMAGKVIKFGVGHRAASAQDCCDKCATHAQAHATKGRACNIWTFCGLPVCWGLDSGWNHTYGECWLRHQPEDEPSYGQRGALADDYRKKHTRVRSGCKHNQPWACPPTHVPWTSGMLHHKPTPSNGWETAGGWGNMIVRRATARDALPMETVA